MKSLNITMRVNEMSKCLDKADVHLVNAKRIMNGKKPVKKETFYMMYFKNSIMIMTLLMAILSGCADLKFRWKNVNGERSEAQMDRDWKDCHEHSTNQYAMNECVQRKGYFAEKYYE